MSGAASVPEARVFHTLDALRGIAAIGVVTFHMSKVFSPLTATGGYLAVDLFFMMSGVVLSHAYESRFRAGMGTIDFMRLRLIRLYPLYLLGTLLGVAVTLASMFGHNSQNWNPSSLVRAALRALLFLPNLSTEPVNQLFPLNIPCWSLFFELLVNLMFVLSWHLLTPRRLVILSLLTGATMCVVIAHAGNIDQGSTASSIPIGLVRTVYGFSVGILIARHLRRGQRTRSNFRALATMLVVCVAVTGWPQGQSRAIWDAVCLMAVFPLVVHWGTLFDPGVLLRRLATFLGVTSYALYVLHSPLSSMLNSAIRLAAGRNDQGVGAPYSGVAALALLLAGCWLVDRCIDMPLRRYLNRIVPRMPVLARSYE